MVLEGVRGRAEARQRRHALMVVLVVLALFVVIGVQTRGTRVVPTTLMRSGDDANCARDYEACGAVPAPVGSARCCSKDFFCYRQAPYFSQCRPRCARIGSKCNEAHVCCAGASCAANGTCALNASQLWAPWRSRARNIVDAIDRAIAAATAAKARVVALHVDVARGASALDKLLMVRLLSLALPRCATLAGDDGLVVRGAWNASEAREAALVLAAFPNVVGIRAELDATR